MSIRSMGMLGGRDVGVLGLGLGGRTRARNRARGGAGMIVHSRSRAPVDALVAEGMSPAASPRDAADATEAVIVMVTNTPSFEAVMEGPDGVLAGLRPGSLVVDMGTTQVAATRSEEHTSELQSLMPISYAVFCLNKKKHKTLNT